MAYHPRKGNLFKKSNTRKPVECDSCTDLIEKGEEKHSTSDCVLCILCYEEWERKGGKLGDISRFQKPEWMAN